MKKLLIVESPAKIKTISKFLGQDFVIIATMGHIKDLPPKELGIHFNNEISLDYETIPGKEKNITAIKKAAKGAEAIYLAPDPDREGEIIAWHVEQEIEKIVKDHNKIHRIAFNEITKPAIEDALAHPEKVDLNKVAAQQARRILDRLVGYEVSPVLWVKVAKGLSAGRVQSVALKLICVRESEIKNFKQEEYWSLDALFSSDGKTNTKNKFAAELTHVNKKKIELKNQEVTEKVIEKLKSASYKIDSIKDSKRLKNPNAPFMTSTLQQAAYNQLGFSVTKTMTLAQKLYEGIPLNDPNTPQALITYMRTDSLRISPVAIKQARTFISSEYGKDYLPSKEQVYAKSKASSKTQAQDAHEAVRPIDVGLTPGYVSQYLGKDEARLYELIWKRFVACQVKPAEYAQRQVVIDGTSEKNTFTFKVTGSTLIFDGYLKVYNDEAEEENKADEKAGKIILPSNLEEGMALTTLEYLPKQHFTQPPPRYTEASLVKEMEKEGIGRPSTYATILKTIQARAYTELDTKKRFVPTELGNIVTDMLDKNLPQIMNVSFTASMEEKLDEIAQGDLNRDKLVNSFYTEFTKELDLFRGQAKKVSEKTDIICPDCKGQQLVVRYGKAGPFLGCPAFPTCKFTSNFERDENNNLKLVASEGPQLLEEKCPNCQSPMIVRKGRFGPFTACSGYPKCNYIKQNKSDIPCPLCKKDIVEKSWKGKKFWTCSGYPKCKLASFSGTIQNTKCTLCKFPFLVQKEDGSIFCANKECDYKFEK